jgi:hypothetical protein
MRATCPAHHIFLALITLTILVEELHFLNEIFRGCFRFIMVYLYAATAWSGFHCLKFPSWRKRAYVYLQYKLAPALERHRPTTSPQRRFIVAVILCTSVNNAENFLGWQENVAKASVNFSLTLWIRSSSKQYLNIQAVPQRKHNTSPLQRSVA